LPTLAPTPAESEDPTCYYSFNAAGSSTLTLAYLVTLTQINGGNVRCDVSLLGGSCFRPSPENYFCSRLSALVALMLPTKLFVLRVLILHPLDPPSLIFLSHLTFFYCFDAL
jgi:hypothetical protein